MISAKNYRIQFQLWSKNLAGGKDWNNGAGLHRARIAFSYSPAPAVRGNEPLWRGGTLFEPRFHQETGRVVSGFHGSSRGRGIRKRRRSGKADRRHCSNLYLFHTSSYKASSFSSPSFLLPQAKADTRFNLLHTQYTAP